MSQNGCLTKYDLLMAETARHLAEEDYRLADKGLRKAIALEPGQPTAYHNLGVALSNVGRYAEAAQSYLQAAARYSEPSVNWADSTASAFNRLLLLECDEVAKPEWWDDEALKVLSKTVIGAAGAGNRQQGLQSCLMRAQVLSGQHPTWESGPRSAADLKEAAKHSKRAAQLSPDRKREYERFAADLLRQSASVEADEAEFNAMVRVDVETNTVADAPISAIAEEAAETVGASKTAATAASASKAPS